MAVETIIEGISEYFLKCPLLKDGVFRVDALGPDPVEYTIETGTFDPIVQKYVDGSSIRQYQFSFGSREYYDMDRLQNIENIMLVANIIHTIEGLFDVREASPFAFLDYGRPFLQSYLCVWMRFCVFFYSLFCKYSH